MISSQITATYQTTMPQDTPVWMDNALKWFPTTCMRLASCVAVQAVSTAVWMDADTTQVCLFRSLPMLGHVASVQAVKMKVFALFHNEIKILFYRSEAY